MTKVHGDIVLQATGLTRSYDDGGRDLTVLHGVDVTARRGESLAIVGPSGSGKSTMLGLLAGLDTPTAGRVEIAGVDIANLSPGDLAAHRGAQLGFVFQSYRLFPYATALENVCIPLELRRLPQQEIKAKAETALERVGLAERLHHRPNQLSGGEQQRVAIARALITEPALLLADEPTGNLDERSGALVEELLFQQCREAGIALVIVTHDLGLAKRADHMLRLRDGHVVTNETDEAATA